MQRNLTKIAEKSFLLKGEVLSAEPYGEGHINSTYLVTTSECRYIMQKMNTEIFPDTVSLMNNICGVTQFLQEHGIESLHVVPTKDGKSFHSEGGECYRVFDFIENTVVYQQVPSADVFRRAGKAFGEFQRVLSRFNASALTEVLPHFHDTPKRFRDFTAALESDAMHRADGCKEEIAFVLAQKDRLGEIVNGIADGSIPLRVTHNDTKLNNILMDADTDEARAIIDFDTIMPGSMLYDFGDSIRFGASTAKEDEPDLDKVHFDLSLFKAYAEGFCSAVKDSVSAREKQLFGYSAYLMTIECGMRFLADYLAGDTYFSIKYPTHNLVRARTQLRLAKEMWENLDKMQEIIDGILK